MTAKQLTEKERLDLETMITNGQVNKAEKMLDSFYKKGYDEEDLKEYFEKCFNKRLVDNQQYLEIGELIR